MDLNYVNLHINQLNHIKIIKFGLPWAAKELAKISTTGAADFQPDEVIPAEKSLSKTESVELGKPGRYIFHTLTWAEHALHKLVEMRAALLYWIYTFTWRKVVDFSSGKLVKTTDLKNGIHNSKLRFIDIKSDVIMMLARNFHFQFSQLYMFSFGTRLFWKCSCFHRVAWHSWRVHWHRHWIWRSISIPFGKSYVQALSVEWKA